MWFLKKYNLITGKEYQIVSQQERPDVVVEAPDGAKVGIEVSHLFYDHLEAKMLLGRSTVEEVHTVENLSTLLEQLDRLLKKKVEVGRKFSWDKPLILLIRCASPVFAGEDFEGVHNYVAVPPGVYDEIWLLARDEVNDENWTDLIRLA